MVHGNFELVRGMRKVAGSFGSPDDLRNAGRSEVATACDVAEIRLDLLLTPERGPTSADWRHLVGVPLLFTARRKDEGGACELNTKQRIKLLEAVIGEAALIDVEVASIADMSGFLSGLSVPWIASFHDFEKLPPGSSLEDAAKRARDAGAVAFKVAAKLHGTADVARLADFQLADHGIAVSSMGMGALATVSRLLCAQCGSVLNYGFLGETPTAPGQWDAAFLKQAINRLA